MIWNWPYLIGWVRVSGFGCKNALSQLESVFYLEGPESANADDAASQVECPGNSYIYNINMSTMCYYK